MPNGYEKKEYGGHKYSEHDGTSDCVYGCGCWMGLSRSGGPTGLDPGGLCPQNPKDGKKLGGKADYDYVVSERIKSLESRAIQAEQLLKKTSPEKIQLVNKIDSLEKSLRDLNTRLNEIRRITEIRN